MQEREKRRQERNKSEDVRKSAERGKTKNRQHDRSAENKMDMKTPKQDMNEMKELNKQEKSETHKNEGNHN